MRSTAFAFVATVCLAGPAVAAEAPAPTTGSTVLMSPVALPIVVGGQLVNYIFVTLRLKLSPSADAPQMRAKEPYFRDALVRAGHRTPFVRPDNYAVLDDDKLKAAVLRDTAALAGPGMVVSVQVVREQAQHTANLPRPTAPPRR
ncbi:MAG TPA: hypothetical protein VIJ94_03315 [Caulobacteraceae bacterium]